MCSNISRYIRISATLFLVGMTGCAQMPTMEDVPFGGFAVPDDEVRIGEDEHKQMLAMFGGVYGDQELSRYVKTVGQKIVLGNELPAQFFHFTVLNSLNVNAFALPGGYVYVTRGLLSLLSDESELAGVLAHEVAHITSRHVSSRSQQSTITSVSYMFLMILTGGVSEIVERGNKYLSKAYGRDQESEADLSAVHYLNRSGYDVRGLSRVLDKMQKHEDFVTEITSGASVREDDWFASHPSSRFRIATLEQLIENDFDRVVKAVKPHEYLKQIDGLPLFVDPILGPARLWVVFVEHDMTMKELAADAHVATHIKWLEVVNGLKPGEIIPMGTGVKLIVYEGRSD